MILNTFKHPLFSITIEQDGERFLVIDENEDNEKIIYKETTYKLAVDKTFILIDEWITTLLESQ